MDPAPNVENAVNSDTQLPYVVIRILPVEYVVNLIQHVPILVLPLIVLQVGNVLIHQCTV